MSPKTVLIAGRELPLPDWPDIDAPQTEAERRLWMTRRQAIIMELGAIEDYLDLPRSIVPKRKREHVDQERRAS
ncbi:MAG: hypothetical protein IT337_15585 [Thermomicrobiales bacterium]|nr:hypothetical protein [Thermomicrobiales bacterium]